MIGEETKRKLMLLAIQEAERSAVEDQRVHPRVGAVLADANGNVLHTAHRGEGTRGGHAEFILFEKARSAGTQVQDASLFVTLEPCTRRGIGKTPCASRVLHSGVRTVFIGTLDPNPHISGRGELSLVTSGIEIERFPSDLAQRLYDLNAEFFAKHRHEIQPSTSLYAAGSDPAPRPVLASQREALLQQSMDLLTGSTGDVWILAGNLSWLREMQIGLLAVALRKREVRILCSPRDLEPHFKDSLRAATAMGAHVGVAATPVPLRGTLIAPRSDNASMIVIERMPSLHGSLLLAPHESSLLGSLADYYDIVWKQADKQAAKKPSFRTLPKEWLRNALIAGVPAYSGANIRLARVPEKDLILLPKSLERFKLFRLTQLAGLREEHNLPLSFAIDGSPWAVAPPVVEQRSEGLIVIDGAHRVYSAKDRNETELEVLLVEGVTAPLPAAPQFDRSAIKPFFERLKREDSYEGAREEFFRPIRRAFRVALEQS
jgi:pyrimidine deaminase RibD-like protein